MKKLYIAIGAILLIFLALGCSGNNSGSDNTQQSSTATPTTEPAKAPEVKAEPVVIASWTGESIKDTETFTVPAKEWKIKWDTTEGKAGPQVFQIYVYKAGESRVPVNVAANVIGANKDSTVIRGAGDYYLKINTAQPYTITIETI